MTIPSSTPFLAVVLSLLAGQVHSEPWEDWQRTFDGTLRTRSDYGANADAYLHRYKLDLGPGEHVLGSLPCHGFRLFAQYWKQPDAKGTILLAHGYLDHSGQWAPSVPRLLDSGWNVALFDLPGHGLSSGVRMAIDSFAQYGQSVGCLTQMLESQKLARPWIAMCHSTGCSAVLEASKQGQGDFEGVAMLAPLLRIQWWHASKIGTAFWGTFSKAIPRRTKLTSTHDTAFMAAIRSDPLEGREVPFAWNRALYRWNRSMDTAHFPSIGWLIVQGEDDAVVDFKFNLPFFQKRLAGVQIRKIPGAMHHLHNETEPMKTMVWKELNLFLLRFSRNDSTQAFHKRLP